MSGPLYRGQRAFWTEERIHFLKRDFGPGGGLLGRRPVRLIPGIIEDQECADDHQCKDAFDLAQGVFSGGVPAGDVLEPANLCEFFYFLWCWLYLYLPGIVRLIQEFVAEPAFDGLILNQFRTEWAFLHGHFVRFLDMLCVCPVGLVLGLIYAVQPLYGNSNFAPLRGASLGRMCS